MTKIDITPGDDSVKIEISEVGALKENLLATLGTCADGSCACSSKEFEKVESLEVTDSGEGITLNVQTKPGEQIDQECITECIDNAQAEAASSANEQ